MGIKGLLLALGDIIQLSHLEEFRGKAIAVDTYAWLHRAVYSCSLELCLGEETDRHIEWCVQRLALLESYDIRPVFVFDGARLPLKQGTEESRSVNRQLNLQQGHAYLRAGNRDMATRHFQRAVDVTPHMARALQKRLRQWLADRGGWEWHSANGSEREFKTEGGLQNDDVSLTTLERLEQGFHAPGMIVAPYEADAQMAFLSRKGLVEAVITEDSDLIVYGCQRIIFKLENTGICRTLDANDLAKSSFLAPFLPAAFAANLAASTNAPVNPSPNASFRSASPIGTSPNSFPARRGRARSPNSVLGTFHIPENTTFQGTTTTFRLPSWVSCGTHDFDRLSWRKKKVGTILRLIHAAPSTESGKSPSRIATNGGISPLLLILQLICAVAGCDYLSSLPGVGIISARDATLRAIGDVPTVLEGIRRHALALTSVQRILLRKSDVILPRRQKVLDAWSSRENWWGKVWSSLLRSGTEPLMNTTALTKLSSAHKSTESPSESEIPELDQALSEFESFCQGPLASLIQSNPLSWHICPDTAFYAALALLVVRELTRNSGSNGGSFAKALSPTPTNYQPLSPTSSQSGFFSSLAPQNSGANFTEALSNSNPLPSQPTGLTKYDFMAKLDDPPGESSLDQSLALFHKSCFAVAPRTEVSVPTLTPTQKENDVSAGTKIAPSTSSDTENAESGLPSDFLDIDIDAIEEDIPACTLAPSLSGRKSQLYDSSGNITPRPASGLVSPTSSQSFRSALPYAADPSSASDESLPKARISLQRSGARSVRGIAGVVSWVGWGHDVEDVGADLKFVDSQSQEEAVESKPDDQTSQDATTGLQDSFLPLPRELLGDKQETLSAFELLSRTGSKALLPKSPVVNYVRAVMRCLFAFNHQVVFDPILCNRVHLASFASSMEDPTVVLAVGTRARRQARAVVLARLQHQQQVQQQLAQELQPLQPSLSPSPPPQQQPQQSDLELKLSASSIPRPLASLCLNTAYGSQSQPSPVTIALAPPMDSPTCPPDFIQEGRISLGRGKATSPSSISLRSQLDNGGFERVSLSKKSGPRSNNSFLPIAPTNPAQSMRTTLVVSKSSSGTLAVTNQLGLEPASSSSRIESDGLPLLATSTTPMLVAIGSGATSQPLATSLPSESVSEVPADNDPTVQGVDPTLWSLTSLHPIALFAALKEVLLSTCLHIQPVRLSNDRELEQRAQRGEGGYLGWLTTQGKARAHALGLLQPESSEVSHTVQNAESNQFPCIFPDLAPQELDALTKLYHHHDECVQKRIRYLQQTRCAYQAAADAEVEHGLDQVDDDNNDDVDIRKRTRSYLGPSRNDPMDSYPFKTRVRIMTEEASSR